MKLTKISEIKGGQDGAIFAGLLFRFDRKGEGCVYSMKDVEKEASPSPIASLRLDRCDELCPHSNSVVFGSEYYVDGDKFPLLYANIYNNYSSSENRRVGVCCVYRVLQNGKEFETELVGIIELGFVENEDLWISAGGGDVRPYGNFVIDTEENKYYAFNMMDKKSLTRYFTFDLPSLSDGKLDPEFGVPKIILESSDILASFDCEYHNFIQGATMYKGLIYSVEGFDAASGKIPRLRVIDPKLGREIKNLSFADLGVDSEPELIDFYNGKCIYSNGDGEVYTVDFD